MWFIGGGGAGGEILEMEVPSMLITTNAKTRKKDIEYIKKLAAK